MSPGHSRRSRLQIIFTHLKTGEKSMGNILALQKLTTWVPEVIAGEEMLMSTASGICPTAQAEEASPFHHE
jgi:hypothetical protein